MLEKRQSDASSGATARARAASERRQDLLVLPKVFDLVRAVFGPSGSCVRPLVDVVAEMRAKCTFKSGLSDGDARRLVNLLVEQLSGKVRGMIMVEVDKKGEAAVKLDRQADVFAARKVLMQLAAATDSQ